MIKRLINLYREIFGTRTYGKLVRPSPYELVPNISQYEFNL